MVGREDAITILAYFGFRSPHFFIGAVWECACREGDCLESKSSSSYYPPLRPSIIAVREGPSHYRHGLYGGPFHYRHGPEGSLPLSPRPLPLSPSVTRA